MRIHFSGQLADEPEIRIGLIGCGAHSFRHILPTLPFTPVDLAAVCDIDYDKASAYARKFGAPKAYRHYPDMLERENLDAVFIVLGYNERGRPMYAPIALDGLNAGCHVWMEKPGVAFPDEAEKLKQAALAKRKQVMIGYKNMFAPVNRKGKQLISGAEFGVVSMALLEKSYLIPTADQFARYLHEQARVPEVVDFIDHLCHPLSTLIYFFGEPKSLSYHTSPSQSGIAVFAFEGGIVASIAFTSPAPHNGGDERTVVISAAGNQLTIENNIRLKLNGKMSLGAYGNEPDYFHPPAEQAGKYWEPEFCRGQLFSKDLFLIGYYDEINEFARAVLEGRSIRNGTLEQAGWIARVFEAFAQGPDRQIPIPG